MLPTDRIPTHPGEMLVEEFLRPMGISQSKFAEHLKIPIQRVNEIATGKRGVTPETAILFGAALGTSPEFWTNLQASHDLALARSGIERMPPVLRLGRRAQATVRDRPAPGTGSGVYFGTTHRNRRPALASKKK
jgi:addiction module HigA family antidote